jgi:DNA-binding response OmpR family regulator
MASTGETPAQRDGTPDNKDKPMGRALLIEESVPLLSSYADYLTKRGLDIYTAHGANDGLALLAAVRPDVTALDLDLRQTDGFELIRSIRDNGSLCLVVSESDDSQDRIRALSLGADDYVVKPVELEELFLRLRNMLAHRQGPATETQNPVLDLNGVRIDLMTRTLLTPEGLPGAELTATELSMLRVLAENLDRVVSKDALFSAMRGETYSSTTRSLDVGISRLRAKLKNASAQVDVRSVRQAGYILSRTVGQRSGRGAP